MRYCRQGIPFVVWMLVGVWTMVACQEPTEHGGKTPLVQVEDQYLYAEDVAKVLPFGLSAADSAAFMKDYLRKWAEEQTLYKQAERNVTNDERINQLVEEYRRSLILNDYEKLLIQQQMSEVLPEEDLQRYYDGHKEFFVLDEAVVKGVFLKVPVGSPDLKELKKWYKDNSEATLEKLDKYAFRHAVIYEYFYDQWLPISELEGKVIVNLEELSANFEKQRNIEIEDEAYCYLLHVEEYKLKGEVKPYDLARYEIVDLLSNAHRVEFMQKVKGDLYNKALDRGRIIYY